jgi:hypothetical protein
MSKLLAILAAAIGALLPGPSGAAELASVPWRLVKGRVDPREFGIQDETILVIHASAFAVTYCNNGASLFVPIADLGRTTGCPQNDTHYYATLDLPAGSVIDSIGLNTASDTDSVFGLALWKRDDHGLNTMAASFSVPAHDWDTDFAAVSIPVPDHLNYELVIEVENAPNPNYEYFGWVEVHWHRTVSPAPASATFGDVPTSHPFFQFIEALAAAGITGGCGNGNFCPDQPITRKQEAAFISKALGLQWPN